jgi:hypothetical protein
VIIYGKHVNSTYTVYTTSFAHYYGGVFSMDESHKCRGSGSRRTNVKVAQDNIFTSKQVLASRVRLPAGRFHIHTD